MKAGSIPAVGFLAFACASVAAAFGLGGSQAAHGMVLGLGAGAFCGVVLWLTVRLITPRPESLGGSNGRSVWVVFAFLLKLPVYFVALKSAYAAGEAATLCFGVGLVLVYSVVIGWASYINRGT